MAKSLKEQLLEAGLVNRQKANQIDLEKRKQARQQPKQHAQPSPAKRKAEQAQADKAARDRELNRQRELAAERKALAAQVDQLVEAHRIDVAGAEEPYRFVYRGVVKSFYARPDQQLGLASGALALVRYRKTFALVDKATAAKVAERDPGAVAVLHDASAPVASEDDEYAAYKVPDDLKW